MRTPDSLVKLTNTAETKRHESTVNRSRKKEFESSSAEVNKSLGSKIRPA